MLELEILGGFTLRTPDGVMFALPKKARALLAYLAMAGGRPQPRERLADLLWDSGSDEQGRTNLRQALATLRRCLPAGPWLVADGESVGIDPALFDIDAQRFEALSSGGPPEQARAVELYRGDLLDGLYLAETGFAGWLATERARLRDSAMRLLEATAASALASRRFDSALALAGRLVTLDGLNEPGHRLLMAAYAQTGRTAEALRQYRLLQSRLRDELGVPPEAETLALHNAIVGRRRHLPENEAPVTPADLLADPPPDPGAGRNPPARRELRRMSVLSAGIVGYARLTTELDVETLHRLLEAWHAAIENEAALSGGAVHERMGDTALVVFGRDQARDDDPARALATATAVHGRMERLSAELAVPLQARVGLALGPTLLVAATGADNGAVTMAIIGEAVVAAADLRARADPGTTLMSDAFRTEVVDPGGPNGTGTLAGRAAELRQLNGLMELARSGAGSAVCLRGEAGIGKSRLAESAAQAAVRRGTAIHRALLTNFGPLSTHSPRRQLACSILGLATGEWDAETLPSHPLVARLGEAHLLRLYQVAGLDPPRKLGPRMEAQTQRDASPARAATFRLLLAAAAEDAPQLLIVEDVHWASPEALRQLAALSQTVEHLPVLLLLTSRPEPDRLDLAWRTTAGPLITVDLRPLAAADSLALAKEFPGVDPHSAQVCTARANGNPLFLTQLLAAVRDGASATTALPGSVQSLTLGRLDRLDAAERQALRAAAVLGRRVPIEAVVAVAALEAYHPSPAVVGTLVTIDNHQHLGFVHALVRDAIHASLLETDQAQLHRAAADWYRGRDADLVAEHLESARDPGAVAAFADAAAAALARHRTDKALQAVGRGLALAGTGAETMADRHRLRLIESTAFARALDLEAAAAAARAAAIDAPDNLARAQALILEATAMTGRQQADVALALLDAAEAAAGEVIGPDDTGHAEALARIHALRGNIHFPLGRLDACLDAHRKALLWSKRAGTAIAEAGALVGMAWAHYQRGDFATAVQDATACLAIAEDNGHDRIRLSALRVRAVSRIFLLEHAAGLADATAAITLAEEQDDAINECLARTTAGTIHLEQWDQAAALTVIEPAFRFGDRIGAIGLDAAPLWVKGTAVGAMGDGAGSIVLLERARAQGMRGPAIRFAVPRILGTLAFFVPPDRRPALITEGEALLAAAGVAHSAFGFYGSLVHVGLRDGDWALAEHCADGLARFAMGNPAPWAQALISATRVFSALGQGLADARGVAAAAQLHAEARSRRPLSWLRPAMAAVEARVRLR